MIATNAIVVLYRMSLSLLVLRIPYPTRQVLIILLLNTPLHG